MPQVLKNKWRDGATLSPALRGDVMPSTDVEAVTKLLSLCPAHTPTPLTDAPQIAERAGVARVLVKNESGRMGLGSFKALGAACAIAMDAQNSGRQPWETALKDACYVTASAGNHGLSVAAGAALFGARAVIYLADTVPEAFAARLRAKGAQVVRAGAVYEESMQAAEAAAGKNGWTLLSDSSWPGYTRLPGHVMQGYLQMAAEAVGAMDAAPTHIVVQAGVGGMAAAVAAYARRVWQDAPCIIVVEPDAAPALIESIRSGTLAETTGPVSAMGRLDCKTPSMIALHGLAQDADYFVTISEDEAASGVEVLAACGLMTTPSGGAGLAALLAGLPGCDSTSTVLTILSEGPEDV